MPSLDPDPRIPVLSCPVRCTCTLPMFPLLFLLDFPPHASNLQIRLHFRHCQFKLPPLFYFIFFPSLSQPATTTLYNFHPPPFACFPVIACLDIIKENLCQCKWTAIIGRCQVSTVGLRGSNSPHTAVHSEPNTYQPTYSVLPPFTCNIRRQQQQQQQQQKLLTTTINATTATAATTTTKTLFRTVQQPL